MLFLVDILVFVSSIVLIDCAQPRSVNLINLETAPPSQSLPLVQYPKVLQRPLAFSYTQDLKPSETVVDQKRYQVINQEPTEVVKVKKLNTKRILMPKKYLHQNVNVKNLAPERHEDFLIYVPEETVASPEPEEDLLQAPIVVPELSNEELQPLETDDKFVEVVDNGETSIEATEPEGLNVKLVATVGADQKVQESHHKKHKPKPKPQNTKYEEGDEKSAKTEYHKLSKDRGHKGYKGEQKEYKVEKQHHIKVGKAGHHKDKGGEKKKFHKEDDFYAEHHEEDEGNQGSKFDEEGENDKGHATKGTHNVNKKEEYVKKIEFFDEYHEDSDSDEDGGHEEDDDFKEGHHDHKDHHKSDYEHDAYDNHNEHEDTHYHKASKGKHDGHSHQDHHDYDDKRAKKSSHEGKKIWKVVVPESNQNDSKEHKSQ